MIVASLSSFVFSKRRFYLEIMLRCVLICLRTSNLLHPCSSFDPKDPEDPEYTVQDNEYDNNSAGVMSL